MTYRTLMDDIPEGVKRVVFGTFDWRGRARRTDGVVYYLATSIIGWFLASLLDFSSMEIEQAIDGLWAIILLSQVPLLAWAVRRAHDYGASGFIFIPFMAWALAVWAGTELIDALGPGESLLFRVAAIVPAIGFFCALFWNPSKGENRFGPNPRLDEPDGSLDPAR